MRIVHVVRQFWPAVGGLENFVLELASQQLRSGLEPHVLTLNRVHSLPGEILKSSDETLGIPIHRIGYVGSRRYPIAPAVAFRLRPFDIVHVHAVDFFCDFLSATRAIHGRPLVLSTHGGFFHTARNERLKRVFFNTVTRLSLKGFHMVLASSINDERIFRPITDDRLRLFDNGVDTDKLAGAGSADFKPSLIYFGRFSSNKGLQSLITAFAAVKKQVPDACLHLVGNDFDGVLQGLRARITSTIHDDSVWIHTGKDDAGLRAIVNGCSFFVSASQYEGFGLTLVEAMSAGLIPIVSRIPSFEAIIERAGVGIALDFSQPEHAAARMVHYLQRARAHYGGMRAQAIKASQAYGWSHVAKTFQACYSEILAAQRKMEAL